MANIRVTIEKGYQPIVQKAMARLGTDDYKVGIQHILGEWSATQVETEKPNEQPSNDHIQLSITDAA